MANEYLRLVEGELSTMATVAVPDWFGRARRPVGIFRDPPNASINEAGVQAYFDGQAAKLRKMSGVRSLLYGRHDKVCVS